MNRYTVDNILVLAGMLGAKPQAGGLTVDQILQVMTAECDLYIPALLKGIREEYLVSSVDVQVTPALSSSVPSPVRAAGAAFRNVEWLSSATADPVPLSRIEPERASDLASAGSGPAGYVLRGNNLQLVPSQSSGILRLSYIQQIGQLVTGSACGEVQSISGSTVTFNANMPPTFLSGSTYDVVNGQPNFSTRALDLPALPVAGTRVLTFLNGLPAGISPGDFVCLAGTTCIPAMPTCLADLLAQRTAYKIAESAGSTRTKHLSMGVDQARSDVIKLLGIRTDGQTRPIINRWGAGSGRNRRW